MTYLWAPPQYRWTDLLNSDHYDHLGSGERLDRIEVEDWLAPFLELCGYSRSRLPNAAERTRLRRLRSVMARIVSAVIANRKPATRDLAAFNRFLRLAAAHPEVDLVKQGFEIREAASKSGIDRVIGIVARTLAETLAHGERERIKICGNPDCRWVMFDESRNRTRRWCELSACGNIMKVREYRQRQAQRNAPPE